MKLTRITLMLMLAGAALVLASSPLGAWTHCNTDHPEKDCPPVTTQPAPTTTTVAPTTTTTKAPVTTTTTTHAATTTTTVVRHVVPAASLPHTGPSAGIILTMLGVSGACIALGGALLRYRRT